jgi:superfamily II DNA or RNA helicase
MTSFNFPKFDHVVGWVNPNNPLLLNLEGSAQDISKIKKLLTITNKSIQWKVKKDRESIEYYQRVINETGETERALNLIAFYENRIATLEPQIKEELFIDGTSTTVRVPVGFWPLCGKVTDSVHKNVDFEPFLVEGLRNYQVEAIQELTKYKRACIELSTGLGKSFIILSLVLSIIKTGRRAIIVVPTEYLVGQMYDLIKKYHNNVTAVGGYRKNPTLGADVMVITAQSAKKYADNYDTIIIDELHHAPANTWAELLSNCKKATHVYGFTATAFRADGLTLAIHAFCGPIVYSRNVRWGIENGWLKPAKVFLATVQPKKPDGDSLILSKRIGAQAAYKTLVSHKDTMSYAKKTLLNAINKGRKVIILFKTVMACKAFVKACEPELKLEVASSKWKKPIDDFRDGKTNVLVSNDKLLSEGIDIPDANALILLTNHSSDVTTYQAIGRVLRKSPGDAIVVDIAVDGYEQFKRSSWARARVLRAITNDVVIVNKQSS